MISNFYTPNHIIEVKQVSVDGYGAEVVNWVTDEVIEGKLWALSGSEAIAADRQTYFADYKFVTDYDGINVNIHRYADPKGNKYNVKAVSPRTRVRGKGHFEVSLELIK